MRKVYRNTFLILFMGLLTFSLGFGQNLVNGAGGTINNKGNIKFNAAAPHFQNDVATPVSTNKVVNTGTIEFVQSGNTTVFTGSSPVGNSSTERVGGTVLYSSGSAQTITGIGGATYYTLLTLTGAGGKSIPDGVHVGGPTDCYSATNGTRTYAGVFYYDGAAGQNIFGENNGTSGSNRYLNLDFSGGGTKTIVNGGTNNVIADGALNTAAGTATTVNNSFLIAQVGGAGASDLKGDLLIDGATSKLTDSYSAAKFEGAVTLSNGGASDAQLNLDNTGTFEFTGAVSVAATGGSLNSSGTAGTVTVDAGSSLTLGNSANSKVNLAAGRQLIITGTYTNNFLSYTNTNYDVASIVQYNGALAQTIVPTVSTNPYGNLYLDASDKSGSIADIYYANNFSLAGGNLDMGASNILHMLDVTKKVIYNDATHTAGVDGGAEVIGNMRLHGGASFANASAYTFNNFNTLVTFTAGSGYAVANYFQVYSKGLQNPIVYDPSKDVNRKISLTYNMPADFVSTIRAGYKLGDVTSASWTPGYTESMIRDYEAKSGSFEKVATGNPYSRSQAGTIHYVELAGITYTATDIDGTADAGFFSGNDLLLRSGPSLFITVNNGRWSNPNTWDEGVQPGSNDSTLVRHTVHVGFRRTGIDGNTANGQILETGVPQVTAGQLASKVTIDVNANASLLFGKVTSGNADEANNAWKLLAGALLFNNNTAATGLTNYDDADLASIAGSGTLYNGFIMLGSTNTVSFITNMFTNNGSIGLGKATTLQIGD